MKKLIAILLLPLILVNCNSYLDQREITDNIGDSDVFGSYYNMKRYLEEGYTKLFTPDATEMISNGKNHTHVAAFGDEASSNLDKAGSFRSGDWTQFFTIKYNIVGDNENGTIEFAAPYVVGWQGIRIANKTIAEINTPKDITPEQQDQLLGQAYFIRSMCYFQILKRWGGMPYITEPLDQSSYLGIERLSYQETAIKIAADCDLAFKYLPSKWDADNTGRPVKSAALALKSRVLLYAASKTNNPGNDLSRWQAAAKAADVLIKFIENEDPYHKLVDCSNAINARVNSITDVDYTAPEIPSIDNYRHLFLYENISPETLFGVYREKVTASGGTWNRVTVNITYYCGKDYLHSYTANTGLTPNQNVVDKFETTNGLAPEDDPSFNPQNPYIKRDPRFYNTIIYNGQNWPIGATNNIVELFEVGANGKPGAERNPTASASYPHHGYMMKKYWAKGGTQSTSDKGPVEVKLIIPYFRVAEAYLNYAEAAFEASNRQDINAKYSGNAGAAAYTALTALNKIRNRVGMPNLNARYQNTNDFMNRVRNERDVELCFESGNRWWDIMRWHLFEENNHIYGMHITYNSDKKTYPTGYKFEKYEDLTRIKTLTERNYYYPINPADVNQYPEYKQNPGY